MVLLTRGTVSPLNSSTGGINYESFQKSLDISVTCSFWLKAMGGGVNTTLARS